MTALRMERQLYSEGKMFDELAVVNEKIAKLNSQILLEAYESLLKELDELAKPASEIQMSVKKIIAPITFTTINHVNRGLAGAAMDKHTEKLITRAREVYITLLGPTDAHVAAIDMLLAECFFRQQRLPLVRPLLVEALDIYTKAPPQYARQKLLALIKLGQIDRDQNHYDHASVELKQAMDIADKEFKQDKTLYYQAMNSYACLLNETGKVEEAKAMFAKADTISNDQLLKEF